MDCCCQHIFPGTLRPPNRTHMNTDNHSTSPVNKPCTCSIFNIPFLRIKLTLTRSKRSQKKILLNRRWVVWRLPLSRESEKKTGKKLCQWKLMVFVASVFQCGVSPSTYSYSKLPSNTRLRYYEWQRCASCDVGLWNGEPHLFHSPS